jgi:hypothetical protein
MNKAKIALLYLSFIFYLFLIFPNNSFSQTDSSHFKRWSVGIFGEVMLPMSDFMRQYDISPNFGVDISYNINPFLGISLSGTYNFLEVYQPNTVEFSDQSKKLHASYIELTIGGKYFFSKTTPRPFFETNAGYYKLKYQLKDYYWNQRIKSNNFGFNFGVGLDICMYKDILASFKMKFNYAIDTIENSDASYYSFSAGIKYMF